jgi:hypothetical protein
MNSDSGSGVLFDLGKAFTSCSVSVASQNFYIKGSRLNCSGHRILAKQMTTSFSRRTLLHVIS